MINSKFKNSKFVVQLENFMWMKVILLSIITLATDNGGISPAYE